MTESRADTEPGLSEFLSSRARQASDARLAMDVAGGFLVAAVALVWRGPGWHLIASAAVCVLAYGAWGIADRELSEHLASTHVSQTGLRAGRVAATIAGGIAAVALVIGGLFSALGRLIS